MKLLNKSSFIQIISFFSIFNVLETRNNSDSQHTNTISAIVIPHSKTLIYKSNLCTMITKKDIKSIPADIETIVFDSTALCEIPDELFKKISNVQNIVLKHNLKLKKYPASFYELENVKTLDISGQLFYDYLPDSWFNLQELSLTISTCYRFACFFQKAEAFKKLKKLNISYNNFTKIPPEVYNLTQVEVLILEGNHIKKIPKDILKMTSLRHLNLSNNNFKSFKNIGIELIKQLETLNLSYNCLQWDLSSFSHNVLKTFVTATDGYSQLENENDNNLQYLDISHNKTSLSPLVFEGFTHVFESLNTLKMNSSKIKHLPNFIYSLEHLKILDITNNKIAKEKRTVKKLRKMNLDILLH